GDPRGDLERIQDVHDVDARAPIVRLLEMVTQTLVVTAGQPAGLVPAHIRSLEHVADPVGDEPGADQPAAQPQGRIPAALRDVGADCEDTDEGGAESPDYQRATLRLAGGL